jgi:hypothetical protein
MRSKAADGADGAERFLSRAFDGDDDDDDDDDDDAAAAPSAASMDPEGGLLGDPGAALA